MFSGRRDSRFHPPSGGERGKSGLCKGEYQWKTGGRKATESVTENRSWGKLVTEFALQSEKP